MRWSEAGHALDCDVVSQERMMQASILSTGADRAMMTRPHETLDARASVEGPKRRFVERGTVRHARRL